VELVPVKLIPWSMGLKCSSPEGLMAMMYCISFEETRNKDQGLTNIK
jgi:hypothetical protein